MSSVCWCWAAVVWRGAGPVLAGALEQAHTISPQNWLARCALERGCWHWYLWRWSSTEHLSVTPPLHRPCSALLYLRTQQNIHIGLGGWAAAQQNWQRWRNEWLATLNIDMLGWAGLGWPRRYINISYNYRESGRWLAAAGLSRRPTGLVTFTLVLARPPLATTGHHWPPLAHVSTLARPPAPFTALFSSIRDQNRFQQWQAGVRSHCNVWTGSAAVYVGCNNMAMKYDHVLWVRLSNETRQYPVKCLFFCVFFESYLKSSNFIAGTSWVVSVVMPCAEFLLSPGRGPGSSSAQPAGRWGVRGQVRWTDTAPCHQPDCHCRSYFRNKRSPVTGLTRNCSWCVTEHQWMLGAAGLVTSPAQCPLLPAGPLAPWYHGARGPTFCWSDLLFCIDRAEPAQAQAAQAVRHQLFALIWTLRGEGRRGGGGPHWFLGTGSCYLSTVNCLKVILLLFRSQISRFVWFAALFVCTALLHWWMQWYDEDNDDRRTTDSRQPQ